MRATTSSRSQVVFFANNAAQGEAPKTPIQHTARSIVDNFLIEFVATLLILITVVLFGAADDDMRFAPSLAIGLGILCFKDEDLFFPDASATVSVILYHLGAYNAAELLARLFGQLCALAVAFAVFVDQHHHHHAPVAPLGMVFFYELMGTVMEHLTIIYFVVPMLTAANNAALMRKREVTGPPNGVVAHTAFVVTSLHFLLQRGLRAEMNPMATILLAMLQILPLDYALIALAAQCIGVFFAAGYLFAFAPRVRQR